MIISSIPVRAVTVAVILLCAACGRKGPLLPPEALVPAAVTDLKAEQKGERVVLSWSPPGKERGGRPLKEEIGFVLLKRLVQPGVATCDECPSAYRAIREELPGFPAALRHRGRIYVDDTDVALGQSYLYRVISRRVDGVDSPLSNRAGRLVLVPPPPPELSAVSAPDGVTLTWTEVGAPSGSAIVGYNVYRRRDGEDMPPLPLNARPLPELRFHDRNLDVTSIYFYAVRSVVATGDQLAESSLSGEVSGRIDEGELR